jgi:hypothetical protein
MVSAGFQKVLTTMIFLRFKKMQELLLLKLQCNQKAFCSDDQ